MNDQDEYLWSGEGAISLEVAALERQLRPLAWTPRELELPVGVTAVPLQLEAAATEPARTVHVSRRFIPVLAGLAAAAAVFALLVLLRGSADDHAAPSREPGPAPTAQPAGKPSPDLKDPFANEAQGAPGFAPPSDQAPDLKDPFAKDPKLAPRRQVSPDLKDPFSSAATKPKQSPSAPAPNPLRPTDLMDPFKAGEQRDHSKTPRNPGKLYDPFSGEESEPASKTSPDLKDPFQR